MTQFIRRGFCPAGAQKSDPKGSGIKIHISLLTVCLLFLSAPLYAGSSAADFSFTDLEGNNYTSANLKRTPVVIIILSHW